MHNNRESQTLVILGAVAIALIGNASGTTETAKTGGGITLPAIAPGAPPATIDPGVLGFIGKISLSFDAQKIVFDFRQDPGSGFRIWKVQTDGTGLRQISHPPADEAEKVARWGKPGTPMTFTRVTSRTAKSCFPRRAVSTPSSAAGRRTWCPPGCIAWRRMAVMSSNSRRVRSASSAR